MNSGGHGRGGGVCGSGGRDGDVSTVVISLFVVVVAPRPAALVRSLHWRPRGAAAGRGVSPA